MIKYIKDSKKTKSRLYILRDFDGNIIDVRWGEHYGQRYYLDGEEISEVAVRELDYQTRYRSDRLKIEKISVEDVGYEKVHPFAFEASFRICGTGGGKSYDSLVFELIDGPLVESSWDWKAQENIKTPLRVEITTNSFYHLITLLDTDPKNFLPIIKSEYSPEVWNNLRLKGFKGIWKFEFNKPSLAIAPYVEEIKD